MKIQGLELFREEEKVRREAGPKTTSYSCR